MTGNKTYTREIKKQYNRSATWTPDSTISLGDVGKMIDYEFDYRTSLKNLGIPFRPTPEKDTQTDYRYYSAKRGKKILKFSGAAPIPQLNFLKADAGVGFEFNKNSAIIFHLYNCTKTRIDDLHSLEKELLSRYRAGTWDRDYVVVTEVTSASSATILVSENNSSAWGVKVKAGIDLANVNLADFGARVSVSKDEGFGINFDCRQGLTPLYKAHALRRKIFSFDFDPRIKLRLITMTAADLAKERIISTSEVEVIQTTAGPEQESDKIAKNGNGEIVEIDANEKEIVAFEGVDYADFASAEQSIK